MYIIRHRSLKISCFVVGLALFEILTGMPQAEAQSRGSSKIAAKAPSKIPSKTQSKLQPKSQATSQPEPQGPKLVELTEDGRVYEGKIVAHSSDEIWLMQRDGQLRRLKVPSVSKFRKISDRFEPYTAAELRDLLRREFRGMEVVGTGNYLVVGPAKSVRGYAQIFEDQYRAFRNYFSVRNFDLYDPEFPLVAIVFPDQTAFAKSAKSDGFRVTPGLKGYYIPSTNRVSLFQEQPAATTRLDPRDGIFSLNADQPDLAPHLPALLGGQDDLPWASTEGSLESTMIHEATHQVAFNTGIHNRLGVANPRWLVEGLATAFEAPGMRSTSLQHTPGAKLNQNRLVQFREFLKQRRRPKTLETFIATGNLSDENILDGYAQSWALTYFLIETRHRDYARYLKLIAARHTLGEYTDADRLVDFRSAFGNDLVLLEAKFLRYLEEVK
jgi:hypothetical protein